MILLFRIRMDADSNKLTYVSRNTYILIKDLSAELRRRTNWKTILLDIPKEKKIHVLRHRLKSSVSYKLVIILATFNMIVQYVV